MAKATPGLRKRGKFWHIEKTVCRIKINESTGETELEAAERYLAKRIEEIRRVHIYGERIERTFDDAAARYVEEFGDKKSVDRDIVTLRAVNPYVGMVQLKDIHAGRFDGFIKDRKGAGIGSGTLTRDMAVIRNVLKQCALYWRDEQGRPWLDQVPAMPVIRGERRKPRPITWDEQSKLFAELPAYLAEMALFMVNTGLRDQELCGLRWEWMARDGSCFVLPGEVSKNGRERIVPLNSVCRSILGNREQQGDYVFTHESQRLRRMTGRAWYKAQRESGIEGVRVHDLRHTFARRLRAAGVDLETREDLLGHHAGRITTHYSKAEISKLLEAVEMLCEEGRKPELLLIRSA